MASSPPAAKGPARQHRAFAPTRTPGVYRRPSGAYAVIWRGADGKTHSRTFPTYEDAVLLKAEIGRDRRRGVLKDPSSITLGEYLDDWLESYAGRTRRGISRHTLADYGADLEAVRALIGDERLVTLTRAHVRSVATALQRGDDRRPPRPRAPRTVAKLLAPLRAALADAVEDDLIPRNPAAGIRVRARTGVEEPAPKRRALSDEEVRALIAGAEPPGRLLVQLVAETGVRIGEAVAIRWADVTLEEGRGELAVARAIRRGAVKETKSAHGQRRIPMSDDLVQRLAAHRAEARFAADDDYVFATVFGNAPDPTGMTRRVLKPAAAAAGIELDGAWHVLRHTAITRWIAAGMPPKTAQELAGHHSPAFTLAVYAEVREKEADRAREWVRGFED